MTDLAIIDRTREKLRAMGQMRGPVLVGPWLSEIGFELLYWIPWLRWACQLAKFRHEDVYVISRGGCRSWYADIGAHYIDALDFYTPEQFRAENERRMAIQASHAQHLDLRPGTHSPKQHEVSDFDRAILSMACNVMELPTGTRMIHPSMMYAYFKPYWRRKKPDLYQRSSVVSRLIPPLPTVANLGSYVAMKFYGSACLPPTDANRRLVQQLVDEQASVSDVVLLHSPTRYDDHAAFPVEASSRVHQVTLPAARNLDIQTEVISKASRFIGTYGGFSYLAPFLGVEALAVYDVANFRKDHRKLMERLCEAPLRSTFRIEELSRARQVVAARKGRHAA